MNAPVIDTAPPPQAVHATTLQEPPAAPLTVVDRAPQVPAPAAPITADMSATSLLALALQRGASLDQLDRLLALQERMERTAAERAFNEALAAFKAEHVEIIKRKRVRYDNTKGGVTEYTHAELSDVVEVLGPVLSRHGFAWSWKLEQEPAWIRVTCTLKHRLGHTDTATLGGPPDNSGGKNAIQAITSAVTYLERATLKAVAGVSEKGDDNDGRGAPGGGDDDAGGGQRQETEREKLLREGNEAAANGPAALNTWWASVSPKQRNAVGKDYLAMRRSAAAAGEPSSPSPSTTTGDPQ